MSRLPFILLVTLALAGCATTKTPSDSSALGSTPQTREFHLFTSSLEFNETTVGIPHDTFSPDFMIVNKGDTVVIQYHNLEDTDEHHTFTMTAPYPVDKDLAPNEATNITFVASTAGVFPYRCTFHQPTMTGYIVVLQ